MGQITVRNIDNHVIERLELKARSEGRTLEDLIREVLAAAVPEIKARPTRAEIICRIDEIYDRSKPGPELDWEEIRNERDARHFVEGVDDERYRP